MPNKDKSNIGPLPIIIGITGHRRIDIGQYTELKSKVGEIFKTLKGQYANSEIIVMSGMAIGADTICAEAALENGCKLIAPLPMDLEEYRKDFTGAESKKLDEMLAQADEVFSVTETFLPDSSRDEYYIKLGEYLTKNSHLLIALWDGDESNILPGGTADVVRMARGKYDTKRKDPLNISTAIPVLKISAYREDEQSDNVGEMDFIDSEGVSIKLDKFKGMRLFDMISAFNSDSLENADLIEKDREKSVESCIKDFDVSKVKNGEKLLNSFVCADLLSLHCQRKRNASIRNISLVSLGLVITFLLYDEIESLIALLIYGVLMVSSVMIFLNVRDRKLHERYLLYRALAEALRIQLYMCIAGIDHKTIIPTWRIDRKLLFVVSSLKNFAEPVKDDSGIDVIKDSWIKDQLSYHNKSVSSKRTRQNFNDRLIKILILVAMLFYCIVVILELFIASTMKTEVIDFADTIFPAMGILTLSGVLKIILGILFAGVAFLANYYVKHALPEKIDNDEKLEKLFALANEELEIHKSDYEYTRSILASLADAYVEEVVNLYVYNAKNAPELLVC